MTRNIPLCDSFQSTMGKNNAVNAFNVLKEDKILAKITGYVTNDVDRLNLIKSCKHFYNKIMGNFSGVTTSIEEKFHLNVSFYKECTKAKCQKIKENETLKDVIVFETSSGGVFIWEGRKELINEDFSSFFKELQRWLMLHNQLVTNVKFNFDKTCGHLVFKEVISLLFEKLANVKKFSISLNLFYIIGSRYPYIIKNLANDERKKIIEIFGDEYDDLEVTRFLQLNQLFSPDHYVELKPTIQWGMSSMSYGNPLGNVSWFKYFRKISNINLDLVYAYFGNQKKLNEIDIYCDRESSEWESPSKVESFENVSVFTYTILCDHDFCAIKALSPFPLTNGFGKNDRLKEIYIKGKMSNECQRYFLIFLREKFPNIRTLWAPLGGFLTDFENFFVPFSRLTSIYLSEISQEQLINVLTFAKTFFQKDHNIKTIAASGDELFYSLKVEDASNIKSKFRHLFIDSEPVHIKDGKYEINVSEKSSEFNDTFSEKERLIRSNFIMSNSFVDLDKFDTFLLPIS
uniref:F-box domain-containing protein n=1 Tax=Parastrongyloides trichosuri TaxID=131310 RepID=A0A0N4ZIK2_PARTI